MKNFNEQCYELLRQVPKGKVTTYKEIANALNTSAYRAVGNAMRNNPYAPKTPCHRCVGSNGTLGGFRGKTTGFEIDDKVKMLTEEGIDIRNGKIQNFSDVLHRFV